MTFSKDTDELKVTGPDNMQELLVAGVKRDCPEIMGPEGAAVRGIGAEIIDYDPATGQVLRRRPVDAGNADFNYGHDAPVPEGYRRLEVGEEIRTGDLYWARDWEPKACHTFPDWSPVWKQVQTGHTTGEKSVAFIRKVRKAVGHVRCGHTGDGLAAVASVDEE